MSVFVIDISNWQDDVNMSTWSAMNVRGCIAKALEGMTGVDKQWANNKAKLLQMKGPNFIPGAYHYMNHVHPAADQCKAFLDLVPSDWIHALDVEAPGPLDVDGWFAEYRKHYPDKTVLLYTNEPMWRQISKVGVIDAASRYAPVQVWIAGAYRGAYQAGTDDFRKIWSRVPAGADGGLPQLGFEEYALMQYSGSAAVPGVRGDCDASVAGSVNVLKQLAAVNTQEKDMPLSTDDLNKIGTLVDQKLQDNVVDIVNAILGAKLGTSGPNVAVALQSGYVNTVKALQGLDNVPTSDEAKAIAEAAVQEVLHPESGA